MFFKTTDYLLDGKNDDIDLSNIEVLFRMTSDGLTEEEKVIFRDELIEFMKEHKKLFDEDKKWDLKNIDNSVEWFVRNWQKKSKRLYVVSAVGEIVRLICFCEQLFSWLSFLK